MGPPPLRIDPTTHRTMGERSFTTEVHLAPISNRTTIIHVSSKEEEGNVLFNDVLNTFYLRLYGVGKEEDKCICLSPTFMVISEAYRGYILVYTDCPRDGN